VPTDGVRDVLRVVRVERDEDSLDAVDVAVDERRDA
jgi:hypothetical protein